MADQGHRGEDVGVKLSFQLFGRYLYERAERPITGIVDEDIDPSLLLQHPLNDSRSVFFIRNVQPVGGDTRALQILNGLEPSCRGTDVEIPGRESGCKSPADAGRTPRYEYGFFHVVRSSIVNFDRWS